MEVQTVMENFFQGSFSVIVAGFLLIRMEKELRLLREAILNLRHCCTCTMSPWRDALDELSKEGKSNEV